MTPRTVRRMIKAALAERDAAAARIADLTAFVRILEEGLAEAATQDDPPTNPGTPTSKSGTHGGLADRVRAELASGKTKER